LRPLARPGASSGPEHPPGARTSFGTLVVRERTREPRVTDLCMRVNLGLGAEQEGPAADLARDRVGQEGGETVASWD